MTVSLCVGRGVLLAPKNLVIVFVWSWTKRSSIGFYWSSMIPCMFATSQELRSTSLVARLGVLSKVEWTTLLKITPRFLNPLLPVTNTQWKHSKGVETSNLSWPVWRSSHQMAPTSRWPCVEGHPPLRSHSNDTGPTSRASQTGEKEGAAALVTRVLRPSAQCAKPLLLFYTYQKTCRYIMLITQPLSADK